MQATTFPEYLKRCKNAAKQKEDAIMKENQALSELVSYLVNTKMD